MIEFERVRREPFFRQGKSRRKAEREKEGKSGRGEKRWRVEGGGWRGGEVERQEEGSVGAGGRWQDGKARAKPPGVDCFASTGLGQVVGT